MGAINVRRRIQETIAGYSIHQIQVSQRKRQLLDDYCEPLTRGRTSKDQDEGQVKDVELFQQIGRLQ